MWEEIREYQKYILNFRAVKKPIMPKFDVLAYTDNEYTSAIFNTMKDFDLIDDEYLTIDRFKGD